MIITYNLSGIIKYVSLFILPVFFSCYSPRYVYSPSTQHIPLVKKRGDFNVGGYFATGGGSSNIAHVGSQNYNAGMDLNSAYALSDHFAIMINKYNRWEKNNGANDFNIGDSSIIKYKRGLTELATGYFTVLRNHSKKSFFQLFAGVAFGKFQINDNSVNNGFHFSKFHNANIAKIFLQPAIIIGPQENFTASFSSRITEVFYNKINTNYSATELDNYLLTGLSSSPVFFWEPAMNYSYAFKKPKGVRVNLQSGFTVLLNKRFIDYRTINLALGITVNNDLFKKKVTKNGSTIKPAISTLL
ncbi:MAG: hypothetical protein ABIO55_04110 [Ginsengibacter sp.]